MPTITRGTVTRHTVNGKAIISHCKAVEVFPPKNGPGVELTHRRLTADSGETDLVCAMRVSLRGQKFTQLLKRNVEPMKIDLPSPA